MIPGDLLSAFPHRQFHTIPGLLDSCAALPNSNPNACMPMQGGSLYHFYDGLWYDPAERRTHDLPCDRGTRYRLSQPDTVQPAINHHTCYLHHSHLFWNIDHTRTKYFRKRMANTFRENCTIICMIHGREDKNDETYVTWNSLYYKFLFNNLINPYQRSFTNRFLSLHDKQKLPYESRTKLWKTPNTCLLKQLYDIV